jgi:hypothetical protein
MTILNPLGMLNPSAVVQPQPAAKLERAAIINTDKTPHERIEVMFNPSDYTLNRSINYAQAGVPGLGGPLLQFVNGALQTLEMELFLDTYQQKLPKNKDVREQTRRITSLQDVNPETHAPPVLLFTWGESFSFPCVLSSVVQRFVLFLPSGTPVRARLQVTFSEYRDAELETKGTKTETADYSKLWVVAQGETLSSIAARVYEDPTRWRPIALRNRIDDPRSLTPGQRLVIPNLPYRDPESGEVVR